MGKAFALMKFKVLFLFNPVECNFTFRGNSLECFCQGFSLGSGLKDVKL